MAWPGSVTKRYLLPLILGAAAVLSGCATAPVEASYCNDYVAAWNEFNVVRTDPTQESTAIQSARSNYLEALSEFATEPSAPDDVKDIITAVKSSFEDSWNAADTISRARSSQYFWNGQDYVALVCEQAGTPISFEGRDVKIYPARD